MAGHKLWSDEENKILVKYRGQYKKLQKELPHRTLAAIRSQCSTLGLRNKICIWSAAEISKLRRMYPSAAREEICAAFPHSPWMNIRQVARYHGIRRTKKPYKLTGIPALDEVRRRCREINWTMSDLDKAARTGTYFFRGGWIGKRINHRALGRAIEALDGTIQADWND